MCFCLCCSTCKTQDAAQLEPTVWVWDQDNPQCNGLYDEWVQRCVSLLNAALHGPRSLYTEHACHCHVQNLLSQGPLKTKTSNLLSPALMQTVAAREVPNTTPYLTACRPRPGGRGCTDHGASPHRPPSHPTSRVPPASYCCTHDPCVRGPSSAPQSLSAAVPRTSSSAASAT